MCLNWSLYIQNFLWELHLYFFGQLSDEKLRVGNWLHSHATSLSALRLLALVFTLSSISKSASNGLIIVLCRFLLETSVVRVYFADVKFKISVFFIGVLNSRLLNIWSFSSELNMLMKLSFLISTSCDTLSACYSRLGDMDFFWARRRRETNFNGLLSDVFSSSSP